MCDVLCSSYVWDIDEKTEKEGIHARTRGSLWPKSLALRNSFPACGGRSGQIIKGKEPMLLTNQIKKC